MSSNRYDPEQELKAELFEARSAGNWLPWASTALAGVWWIGAGAYAFSKFGQEGAPQVAGSELFGLVMLGLAPGLALIVAGLMARETMRSSKANEVVLGSMQTLLSPARSSAREIDTLRDSVRGAIDELNDRLETTESRLTGMRDDIESSSNAAMKAAEIVRTDADAMRSKLSTERDMLMKLSDDIRHQMEAMSEALPKYADKLSRSALTAHEEIRQAGAHLNEKLSGVEDTGKALTHSVANLDQMTADSRKRAQSLVTSLSSINEQLTNSSRMVEGAVNSGEMALEASRNTAAAIQKAMDDALENARLVVERINEDAANANATSKVAVEQLSIAADTAEKMVRAAMTAADEHARETEDRMDHMSQRMFEAATRATHAAEAGLERARQRIERASVLLGGADDDRSSLKPYSEPVPTPEPPASFKRPERAVPKPAAAPKVVVNSAPARAAKPATSAKIEEPAARKIAVSPKPERVVQAPPPPPQPEASPSSFLLDATPPTVTPMSEPESSRPATASSDSVSGRMDLIHTEGPTREAGAPRVAPVAPDAEKSEGRATPTGKDEAPAKVNGKAKIRRRPRFSPMQAALPNNSGQDTKAPPKDGPQIVRPIGEAPESDRNGFNSRDTVSPDFGSRIGMHNVASESEPDTIAASEPTRAEKPHPAFGGVTVPPPPIDEPVKADESKPALGRFAPLPRSELTDTDRGPTPEPPRSDADTESMSWKDLLSGIEEDQTDRHQTALAFVDQLGRAGVRLKRAIRASDLRRICAANNRGERYRRRATRQAAPGELHQIQRLMRQDDDLRIAGESFLKLEEDDALQFLKGAERARDDAGPRLAAFLLLDAALLD